MYTDGTVLWNVTWCQVVPSGAVLCVSELCAKIADQRAGGLGFESRQGQEKILRIFETGPGSHPATCPVGNGVLSWR